MYFRNVPDIRSDPLAIAPPIAAHLDVWCEQTLACVQEHVNVVLSTAQREDASPAEARDTVLGESRHFRTVCSTSFFYPDVIFS